MFIISIIVLLYNYKTKKVLTELLFLTDSSPIRITIKINKGVLRKILMRASSDVLLITEKERLCLNLKNINRADVSAMQQIDKLVDKYLNLINKSIISANRRKIGDFSKCSMAIYYHNHYHTSLIRYVKILK